MIATTYTSEYTLARESYLACGPSQMVLILPTYEYPGHQVHYSEL